MSQWIRLETPAEGVASITLTQPEIRNQGSWDAISQLADALVRVRGSGARVSVLASGLDGHWIEHAWLRDLRATVLAEATSGDGVCWFRALQEITSPEIISLAAIAGDCSGGGAELAWACDLRVAEESARFDAGDSMREVYGELASARSPLCGDACG